MWISDIEPIVFSKVKKEVREQLGDKYLELFFSTTSKIVKEPAFPTVVLRDMNGQERDGDLEGRHINCYQCTFQAEVIDNVGIHRAKEVMRHIVSAFKKMSFSVVSAPTEVSSDNYRMVARFRRDIGWNDVL